jgi:DNA-binding response OmpR family regulator
MIRVSVADHGAGIPEDFRPRIFEKFSQNDSSDRRKVNGTGLGLSIVRAIIERHGGQIDFETEIDKGSTFYFDIPEVIVPQASIDPTPHGQRILVCEDDPDVALVLSHIIERCGYGADMALSAGQARALLERGTYAGMTLDIVLPDMSGVDFFKEIRTNPRTQLLPIIIISAKAAETVEKINGTAINVVDWLDKPVDDERIANAIRAAIAMGARSGQRILHIEDDQDLVQVVARQVGSDVSFVSAGSVAAARQLLGRERFDLVILDLLLPDGHGEELLPAMVNPDGTRIPVIIFSAVEVPAEITQRVAAVLIKTRSTDQMLTEAIGAFVTRRSLTPSDNKDPNVRNSAHG